MEPEVEKNLEEMIERSLREYMLDPKTKEILEALGSDYDEHGIPYWDKDV